MANSWLVLLVTVATLFMECCNSVVSITESNKSVAKPSFTPPTIPSTISSVENRLEYLAMHYWDKFDFKDEDLLKSDSLMGVAVGGYIQVLEMNTPAVIEKSVDVTLGGALKSGCDSFESLTTKLEDYLFNPNSPMRNEELYTYVLRYTVDKAPLDDIYKIRPRKQLEMVLKNRVGEVATDFQYESRVGETSMLHSIKSSYIIIFFNTPDCDDCARVKEYIGESSCLADMVGREELTILGIYPERDFELWRGTEYPSIILNCADTQGAIIKNRLYDLKALPTLYLLDQDQVVVLKDATIEEIEQYLIR